LATVGSAVADYGKMLGGVGRIAKYHPGRLQVMRKKDGTEKCAGTYACYQAGSTVVSDDYIEFYDLMFGLGPATQRGTVVHEVAHALDRASGLIPSLSLSAIFHLLGAEHLTDYGETNVGEYWSEANAIWVYGKAYKAAERNKGGLGALQVYYLDFLAKR
jgi:hypothetical protein